MNKLRKLLPIATIIGLMFYSCGDDGDDVLESPTATGPTSFVTSPDTIWASPGQDYNIIYTGSSVNQLVALYVTNAALDVQDTIALSGTAVTDTFSVSIPSTAQNGTEYFIDMSLEDTDGSLFRKFSSVIIQVTATEFNQEYEGSIWHRFGPDHGAWDLVNNVPMFSSDADMDKDMENNSVSNGAFIAGFVPGAGNTSSYLLDNNFDWENATQESVDIACEAGTPTTSLSDLNEGDKIISLLRNGDHALILVTGVYPDSATAATTNYGLMTFVYKKP